jgi:hypothetical protein
VTTSSSKLHVAATGSAAARFAVPTFAELLALHPPQASLSGPGVACGASRCQKGELCCQRPDGSRCVPASDEAVCRKGEPGKLSVAAACDESSDCGKGERCCGGRVGRDEDGIAVRCVPAAECDKPWDRGLGGPPAREVCTRGGRCDKPDTTCLPNGECVSSTARAACGPEGACPAATPWCLWDEAKGRGECIQRGAWHTAPGVFECDEPADCPGTRCCAGDHRSFCATECDPAVGRLPQLCREASTCGARGGREPSCEHVPALPPGVGVCSW